MAVHQKPPPPTSSVDVKQLCLTARPSFMGHINECTICETLVTGCKHCHGDTHWTFFNPSFGTLFQPIRSYRYPFVDGLSLHLPQPREDLVVSAIES